MGSLWGSSVRQPPSPDQEPRISAMLGGPKPCPRWKNTPQQPIRHLYVSRPLLRPRAQILQAGLQAQAFLRAHRAHGAHGVQGGTEGNLPVHRGAPTCCPIWHPGQKPLWGWPSDLVQSFLLPGCWLWNFWWTTRRVVKKLPRKRRRKGKPHMSTCRGRGKAGSGQLRSGWDLPSVLLPAPGSPATPCIRGPGPS